MVSIISSLPWPIVVAFLIVVGNLRLIQYLESRKPLHKEQYDELSKKIQEIQKEISSLSIHQGLRNDRF